MSTDKPKWDPAVDGIAELVEHQRMVKELRALATGWDNEAARLRQGYVPADIDSRLRLTDPTGLSRELNRRARDLSEKASAIFAIVGRE